MWVRINSIRLGTQCFILYCAAFANSIFTVHEERTGYSDIAVVLHDWSSAHGWWPHRVWSLALQG